MDIDPWRCSVCGGSQSEELWWQKVEQNAEVGSLFHRSEVAWLCHKCQKDARREERKESKHVPGCDTRMNAREWQKFQVFEREEFVKQCRELVEDSKRRAMALLKSTGT